MTNGASERAEPFDGPSHFVRALWGFEVRVRALPRAAEEFSPRRPRFAGPNLWLPSSPLAGVPGSFSDYLFAACAHISAHLRFGAPRFEIKSLKPVGIALVSLLEDARVERLAVAHYPGLESLWAPYHRARPEGVKTSRALFARLARALHDDTYLDDDAWVIKGRQLFWEARNEWHDPSSCRRIGSALANDLGQMRLQFNAKDYAVEPAYRDDNSGLWHFESESAGNDPQLELEAVRRVEGDAAAAPQRQRGMPEAMPALAAGASERSAALRLATDVDTPPSARHPEWDYVIQRERPAFCSVFERPVAPEASTRLASMPARDTVAGKRLTRSALRLANRHPQRIRRLLDGDRLDLTATVATVVARQSGVQLDPRVYVRLRLRVEPPALLLLLDLSESLNATLSRAGVTLLELARDAATLLASSLAAIASDVAIHGFSSNGRHEVGYYRFKDFDDPYDEQTLARLAGMRAHLSTRLGAALRHAGQVLLERKARRKLLLVLTDGEPSDIDVHDPKYLLLDAKQATNGNHRSGLVSFCLGLDATAERSVARIFGAGNYLLLTQLEELPRKLAAVYLRLSA